jgi:hypothetical protein
MEMKISAQREEALQMHRGWQAQHVSEHPESSLVNPRLDADT